MSYLKFISINEHYNQRSPSQIHNNFSHPSISLTPSHYLDNPISKFNPPSKCSVAVFNNIDKFDSKEAEAVVEKLGDMLKQLPHFVLVISSLAEDDLRTLQMNYQSPWVFTQPKGSLMTFICPSTGEMVPKTWQQRKNLKFNKICPETKQQLRIAYNNESMPYFDLKNGNADTDTLEGAVLQMFLDRNNIEPLYMYGNYEWGSIDPSTGLWNGVVGMVHAK